VPARDLPRRTRTYRNHHLDGTRWDPFVPREGDVVVSTAYKAGTTWMQAIVSSLLFVHFDDLLADLAGEMRRVAAFLEIDVPDDAWPERVGLATFESMRERAEQIVPGTAAHASSAASGGGSPDNTARMASPWRAALAGPMPWQVRSASRSPGRRAAPSRRLRSVATT